MKMLYLGIVKNHVKPRSPELCAEKHMDGFNKWSQSTVGKFLTFYATETVAPETGPGIEMSVVEEKKEEYKLHISTLREGICAIAITDIEYPNRVAVALCRKVAHEFTTKYPQTAYKNATVNSPQLAYPELKTYLDKYQNPHEADNIAKIQKELDDTKELIQKSLESVVERGMKLDDMVAKSEGLSAQSKMFYTQAKKQNSCCVVM